MASKSIVAKGTTFNGVESVTFPVSGGGNATFFEISDSTAVASDVASGKYFYTSAGVKTEGTASGGGGDPWTWMGKNPTKVASCLNEKVYLKDSAFATWTPSTTASVIVPESALTTQPVDFNSYDYVVLYRMHTHFDYVTENNPRITDYYYEGSYFAYGYSSGLADITADTVSSYSSSKSDFAPRIFYVTTSGANASVSYSYGVYASTTLTAPSVGGGANITPYAPAINARCSNTYFSTASAGAVNQNTSYYERTIDLYRVDRGTTPQGATYAGIRDMWLNGF